MKQILYISCGGYLEDQLMEGLCEWARLSGEWSVSCVLERSCDGVSGSCVVSDAALCKADLIIRTWLSYRFRGPKTPTLAKHAKKVVVVDASDQEKRSVDAPVALYLKREYYGPERQPWASAPFSFCAARKVWDMDPLPWEERPIDVFYAVGLRSNRIRAEILRMLESLSDVGNVYSYGYSGKSGKLTWDKYIGLMRQSKIAISPHGRGEDANNYWEIPACGVALLAQERNIRIPNNFVEDREAAFFRDAGELPEKIKGLLADDVALERMANRARAKVLLYHTGFRRAQQLMCLVNDGNIGGKV